MSIPWYSPPTRATSVSRKAKTPLPQPYSRTRRPAARRASRSSCSRAPSSTAAYQRLIPARGSLSALKRSLWKRRSDSFRRRSSLRGSPGCRRVSIALGTAGDRLCVALAVQNDTEDLGTARAQQLLGRRQHLGLGPFGFNDQHNSVGPAGKVEADEALMGGRGVDHHQIEPIGSAS